MVLMSGGRYGWIPKSGPLSKEGVSVTEGEYRAAKAIGLPILPFFKNLGDKADRKSQDAKRRDKFREQIAEWDSGQFRSTFDNVVDLRDKVSEAVVRMLPEHFQRQLLQKHRAPKEGQFAPPSPPVITKI